MQTRRSVIKDHVKEYEDWIECTGALAGSWYYECQSIVEDAQKALDRMSGNAAKSLKLLRDFYVAYHKEEWQEGESADAITTAVRIFLDQAVSDGFEEAKVDDGE